MLKSRPEILSTLQNLKKEAENDYSVKKIGIFGSYARNEGTEESDIDLLVEFSQPVGFVTFIRLENFFFPTSWKTSGFGYDRFYKTNNPAGIAC